MLRFRARMAGFSLIETLIGIVISLILIIPVLTICASVLEYSHRSFRVGRLELELNNALNMMANDIRRAGYWAGAVPGNTNNPYMQTNTALTTATNCVLLTYDLNKDGQLPGVSSLSDDEHYGFRLSNGVLQAKTTSGNYSCTATGSGWMAITDPKDIVVTQLSFILQPSTLNASNTSSGITIRNMIITVAGRVANDATISKTLTRTVHVYNNLFRL